MNRSQRGEGKEINLWDYLGAWREAFPFGVGNKKVSILLSPSCLPGTLRCVVLFAQTMCVSFDVETF